MSDQKIKIRLPNAREKLQPLFPQDNRGDIKIVFRKKSFKLQKAFLRLQSGFFKRTFAQTNEILQIKQQFNQTYFSNILKCFYGFTIQILRSQILEYYPIIKYLQVESLLKLLREDMINKAQHYDIFILMQLAHKYDEQEIFQICLSQLEKQGFQQLRYAKHELLRCSMELFKMIIKTHNRMRSDKIKGIQFLEIDQLIKQFSEQKRLNQSQYQELKFELIDKKSLTSQQYKEIFLDDAKRKKNDLQYKSMIKLQPQSGLFNSGFGNNLLAASKLTQSVIQPLKKMNDQLTMEMENTFQKKKNEQLQAQNKYLLEELKQLQETTNQNKKNFEQLKEIVLKLQKQLQEKQKIDREQNNIIKRLEKMCNDLKKEITDKGEMVKKLEDKITRIVEKQPEKRTGANPKYLKYDQEEEDESKTVQSQIVPGHMLKEISKPVAQALIPPSGNFKKTKKFPPPVVVSQEKVQSELDEEQIQQLYLSRLEFNEQPKGCPKKYLPKLANFLTNDGFQKKKLNLIFRRSQKKDDTIGFPSDIRNKNSLLVLICTKSGQVIGGFTSIMLLPKSCDYIADENAFIFSLTKNEKFNIKKSHINEAIFISQSYLIGFSNDIMISSDCIRKQCECSWPEAYENGGDKRGSRWLTGEDNSFTIKELQIYEVKQELMIMDL